MPANGISRAPSNRVLASVSDALLSRFPGSCIIEFHPLDHLWNQGFLYLGPRSFKRLLRGILVFTSTQQLLRLDRARWSGREIHARSWNSRSSEKTRSLRVSSSSIPPSPGVDNTSRPQLVLPRMLWKPDAITPSHRCGDRDDQIDPSLLSRLPAPDAETSAFVISAQIPITGGSSPKPHLRGIGWSEYPFAITSSLSMNLRSLSSGTLDRSALGLQRRQTSRP